MIKCENIYAFGKCFHSFMFIHVLPTSMASGSVTFIQSTSNVWPEKFSTSLQQWLVHIEYSYSRTNCTLYWLFIPPFLCPPSYTPLRSGTWLISKVLNLRLFILLMTALSPLKIFSRLFILFFLLDFLFKTDSLSLVIKSTVFKCRLFVWLKPKKNEIKHPHIHRIVLISFNANENCGYTVTCK